MKLLRVAETIEAMQYTGDNLLALQVWGNQHRLVIIDGPALLTDIGGISHIPVDSWVMADVMDPFVCSDATVKRAWIPQLEHPWPLTPADPAPPKEEVWRDTMAGVSVWVGNVGGLFNGLYRPVVEYHSAGKQHVGPLTDSLAYARSLAYTYLATRKWLP